MGRILLTGGAGFIGSHVAERMLSDGHELLVVDNFDPYYSIIAKKANARMLAEHPQCTFVELDLRDAKALFASVKGGFDAIVHLAAKAGVRSSIQDPAGYQESNVYVTQNLLDLARELGVKQFVFASSSSVYGVNNALPWREDSCVLMPASPYASTKVSAELMGHVYSHLFGIRFLALRFFTVYGPRQRPDLAIHKFSRLMLNGLPIPVFGDGSSMRDYTYVDDIVDGVVKAVEYDRSAYEVFNLGNDHTISLMEMIRELEEVTGQKALVNRMPEMKGDLHATWADIGKARRLLGYSPSMVFREGLRIFTDWLTEDGWELYQ